MGVMASVALGLMSGTSCDGISAALGRFQKRSLHVLAARTTAYPASLGRRLQRSPALSARELSALNMELGEHFARAAQRLLRITQTPPTRVTVIGSHGHTIYHGPTDSTRSTLQLAEPAIIAQRTGIPVVANFRPRDIAARGTGAPLIPFFDKTFFGHGPTRALQNVGGIANVTVVGQGVGTRAFDTGPGNCLIDVMAARITHGRWSYDAGGCLALRGRIDHRAVARLWHHPYFRQPPPKSTGREVFNDGFLHRVFGTAVVHRPADVLATVTYFTAYSIAESYRRWIPHRLREVIVSGGGVHNRTLMRHLAHLLVPIPVYSIEDYGIPAQAKEPIAFAFLALRAIQGRINHLPQTTGATCACILGNITPGVRK